jgi:signal transduction histidine kinase
MTTFSEPLQAPSAVRNPERLAAVLATGLLDTPVEPEFDRLTRLAAKLTGAPVTFLSLVTDDRDFYKSCFGFPEPLASERQLTGTTFCHFALVSKGPLVIENTLEHPIYRDVPTVHTLGVRAYLGIPLVTSAGAAIGSFCAIDFAPRQWSPLDIEVMQELAGSTLREIELRTALHALSDERHRLQILATENARLYEAAQVANRAKDDFFAAVTHELRTPMTSIIGWARMLRQEQLDSPDAVEAVDAITSSARVQAQLVDDLLDVSRIATGKLSLKREPLALNEAVQESVTAATPAAASKGVHLRVDLGTDGIIDADRSRLRQIVGNILSNSIKFTPSGGLIAITAQSANGHATIRVQDTGRGIDAEFLPHIFDRFRQSESAEQGGLGLGLTIVRHLVEMHGGTIRAESEGAGKGSTFVVTLPLTA